MIELNRIYQEDCLETMRRMPDKSVDMIMTDPPYGHNNNDGDLIHAWEKVFDKKRAHRENKARPILNDGPEANELVRKFFVESNRILKPGGCCCCCCCGGGGPDPQFARWTMWLDEAIGFKHAVVWDKGGLGMGIHYRRSYEFVLVAQKKGAACKWYGDKKANNIIRNIPKIIPQGHHHPTEKPIKLFQLFISLHSAIGDVVYDPFLGSGTTALACIKMGRNWIGSELDEQWVKMAEWKISHEKQQILMPFDQAVK